MTSGRAAITRTRIVTRIGALIATRGRRTRTGALTTEGSADLITGATTADNEIKRATSYCSVKLAVSTDNERED